MYTVYTVYRLRCPEGEHSVEARSHIAAGLQGSVPVDVTRFYMGRSKGSWHTAYAIYFCYQDVLLQQSPQTQSQGQAV